MRLMPIYLDFESFWDTDHTLSKMPPTEYVMSPKTEIISLAMKIGNGETDVYFGEKDIAAAIDSVDWSSAMAIGHNMSGFDCMILAWRFKVRPAMWGCTAAMARSKYAKTCGVSLAKLVQELGVGVKNNTILMNTKGRYLKDFTAAEIASMRVYNREDTEQCAALFKLLASGFPKQELLLIHMTTQMLVNPQFVLDTSMVEAALSMERDQKLKALLELDQVLSTPEERVIRRLEDGVPPEEYVRSVLASAKKFSDLLESRGVPVPMKVSPTTGKLAPALSKTDEEFIALQEHEDPVVAAAARTRLAVKSTLLETRLAAFLRAGAACGGRLPVPLRYCGADTTGRWSGEQYNMQNLPRIGSKVKPSDALRNSLKAPKGYKVVVADLSGIELRVNHFLWKVPGSMELYAEDAEADLYRAFAAARYGITPDEVTKDQRQLAKVAQLGLGFGAGAATFRKVAKLMGGLELSESEANDVVTSWRDTYHPIVSGWKSFQASLPKIMQGVPDAIDPWGLCMVEKNAVRLPSGRRIYYPSLIKESDNGKSEWWYGQGRHRARIYAGKGVENCLAEGTLVLTDSGWTAIEDVRVCDLVHDGVEFVRHAGTVFKSVQPCVTVDGVYMTADHEVLTDDGWEEASQVQRPYRPDIRNVGCIKPRDIYGGVVEVEIPVPVRNPVRSPGERHIQGDETRRNAELRMCDKSTDVSSAGTAWYEQASGVCRVAKHVRSLQTSIASSMEKLRRSGSNRLRSLAGIVRELLGGCGVAVPAWAGFGPYRQQRPVLSGKLSVDITTGQLHEQENNPSECRYTGTESGYRNKPEHVVQPTTPRMEGGRPHTTAGLPKPVYDIVNCGPRHRFVVRGLDGPMVVHNCVQAIARDVVADNAVDFYKLTKLEPALTVHDELVYVVPEVEAQGVLDELQKVMRTPPKWWPELITWSEGDIADTYGAAK
jgi:hypothetical protein